MSGSERGERGRSTDRRGGTCVYSVPANRHLVKRAVEKRNEMGTKTIDAIAAALFVSVVTLRSTNQIVVDDCHDFFQNVEP